MELNSRYFPDSFIFGSSVSPYQVEGNVSSERHNDWDEYFKTHPRQQPFTTREIGPDWWSHPKAEEDLNRLKSLGLQAQRLGFEWARIEPEKGKFDKSAIARYRAIITHVQDLGMAPLVTLNHFTLPDWLGKEGGYVSSSFDSRFKYYTECIADKFGDVKNWLTWNEPSIVLTDQYLSDAWPPRKRRVTAIPRLLQNMRRANHVAYDLLKQKIPDSQVGSVHTMVWLEPHNPKSFFQRAWVNLLNHIFNKLSIDITTDKGNDADFFGYDYYVGYLVKPVSRFTSFAMKKEGLGIPQTFPPCFDIVMPEGYITDTGWPIAPKFFLNSLEYMHKKYPDKPIVITENGLADKQDKYRAFSILTHLAALHEAIQRGVDIRGYYYWSSVDSLEWMAGYSYRFGLIDVNPETGKRSIRKSANLYKEIVASREIDVEKLARRYLIPEQAEKAREIISKFR